MFKKQAPPPPPFVGKEFNYGIHDGSRTTLLLQENGVAIRKEDHSTTRHGGFELFQTFTGTWSLLFEDNHLDEPTAADAAHAEKIHQDLEKTPTGFIRVRFTHKREEMRGAYFAKDYDDVDGMYNETVDVKFHPPKHEGLAPTFVSKEELEFLKETEEKEKRLQSVHFTDKVFDNVHGFEGLRFVPSDGSTRRHCCYHLQHPTKDKQELGCRFGARKCLYSHDVTHGTWCQFGFACKVGHGDQHETSGSCKAHTVIQSPAYDPYGGLKISLTGTFTCKGKEVTIRWLRVESKEGEHEEDCRRESPRFCREPVKLVYEPLAGKFTRQYEE